MWKKGKGFTLIELMVVIAIILILALIAIPAYRNMQERAKKSRVEEDFRTLATMLETFYIDWNKYPATDTLKAELTGAGTGATINVSNKKTSTGEEGPIKYIATIPQDPFQSSGEYKYTLDTNGTKWTLTSAGPDGSLTTATDNITRSNE